MQREILLNNINTKNILTSSIKYWKKFKRTILILPLASSLQDLKPGQIKKMNKCSTKFANFNGKIHWDLTLFNNKPFMAPWQDTIKLSIEFWKNTLIWTTKRCIMLDNQKTRQTRTWKSPFSQVVWESVTVSTPYKELNSWPTRNTFALNKIQLPIFCWVTQETQEMPQPQFCSDLDSQWPSTQTIQASSDSKMRLQITLWLQFPTSGDLDIWSL